MRNPQSADASGKVTLRYFPRPRLASEINNRGGRDRRSSMRKGDRVAAVVRRVRKSRWRSSGFPSARTRRLPGTLRSMTCTVADVTKPLNSRTITKAIDAAASADRDRSHRSRTGGRAPRPPRAVPPGPRHGGADGSPRSKYRENHFRVRRAVRRRPMVRSRGCEPPGPANLRALSRAISLGSPLCTTAVFPCTPVRPRALATRSSSRISVARMRIGMASGCICVNVRPASRITVREIKRRRMERISRSMVRRAAPLAVLSLEFVAVPSSARRRGGCVADLLEDRIHPRVRTVGITAGG